MRINGLFQTEDYAVSLMGTMLGDRVPELVAKRMERQAFLHRDNAPRCGSHLAK